jgi:hypothetical protein
MNLKGYGGHTTMIMETLQRNAVKIKQVEIPLRVESLNKFMWAHWRNYANYKTKWHKAMNILLGNNRYSPKKKLKIKITSYRTRMLDDDNFRGGCKPILDYLEKAGYVENDKNITAEYEQIKARMNTTILEIYEESDRKTQRNPF